MAAGKKNDLPPKKTNAALMQWTENKNLRVNDPKLTSELGTFEKLNSVFFTKVKYFF